MGSVSTDDEPEETSDSDDFLRAVARAPDVAPESAPARDSSRDLALTQIAHFRIEGELGRGGMGIVYRARDEKLERVVALKILARDIDSDPARRRRFLREAKLAASITHPNVATVHEIGETDGRIYIAMELVAGTTLRRRIEESDPGDISVAEAIRIVKEIARGVARAHERGIAHRDLKPDNVIVGADGAVKVLDFGLAKPTDMSSAASGEPSEAATMTQEGRIMGTPGYMSPEQATGKPLDVRTDVFSLGVVLYELIAGKRPFVGDTPMDVVIATSRDAPAPLSDVPAGVERVVARCLDKDASRRFANATELLSALEGVDLRAVPVVRSSSRSRIFAAAGIAALATGLLIWRSSVSSPAREVAPQPAASVALAQPEPARTASTPPPEQRPEPAASAPPVVSANATTPSRPVASSRARDVRPQAASAPSAAAPRPAASAIAPVTPGASSPGGGVIQQSPY